ncbi:MULTISPECIES: tetratricopeptide repeat protein [Aerosakkonema]|uniref:tetratricopeptide repeat protein n=1 Tax=Aerosakkonema TaxID=1246629 RepID=UPI0035B72FD1
MSRSVRVRLEYIETVKMALKRNGYVRQQDLAEHLAISRNTINKFFNGKPIDYLNFIEICEILSLKWQKIADLDDYTETPPENVKEKLADSLNTQTNRFIEKRVILQQSIPTVPVWKGRDELISKLKEILILEKRLVTVFLNPTKVLALIGQAGIGKTSLAVKLLEEFGVNLPNCSLSKNSPYDCVIYFKAQDGTTFDHVAEFLLDGLGIETPETLKNADEKIGKIIASLAETRCLLVLDNLESVLHPANHPQAGKAVSLDLRKLLNALAYQQHISQTIITSREVPADLADTRYEGAEPDTELVHIERLTGVSTQAGVEILQQRQLKDQLEDLLWISERVKGHVFLLTQLAAIGKGKPGYLRKHPELVTKKAEPILQEQLARQSEAARDLLKRMCVLRVPIDVRGLTFLRLYTDDIKKNARFLKAAELGEPAEFTEEEIRETEAILERLVDSSLVHCRYDEEKFDLFYDLHPVIMDFMQGECKEELPKLLESVYKFYCTGKNVENPKTLEDLRPVLEAQYFAFQLGNYSEAYYLIKSEYLYRWGYWNLLKDLYEQVIPHLDDDKRQICLQWIATIYREVGNWDTAEKYYQDALAIAQEQEDKSNIASCQGMLGYIERNRGNWEEAERLYRQSLQLRTELGDRAGMASSWGVLGDIEQNRGNWEEAERLYRQCLQIETELGDRAGMASSWASLGDIERNRGNWEEAVRLSQQSLELFEQLGDPFGIVMALDDLGKTEICRGNLDAAEPLLFKALQMAQQLGITKYIAVTNYDLAQLYRQRNNPELAQQHYNTAHQIFQQLGAAKDLERIEKEWKTTDLNANT